MSDGIEALKAAYVSQMQRAYHSFTRGIATPEDCQQWEADADRVIRKAKAEAWDEGMKAGLDNGLHIGERIIGTRRDWPDGPPPNPYRGGQ